MLSIIKKLFASREPREQTEEPKRNPSMELEEATKHMTEDEKTLYLMKINVTDVQEIARIEQDFLESKRKKELDNICDQHLNHEEQKHNTRQVYKTESIVCYFTIDLRQGFYIVYLHRFSDNTTFKIAQFCMNDISFKYKPNLRRVTEYPFRWSETETIYKFQDLLCKIVCLDLHEYFKLFSPEEIQDIGTKIKYSIVLQERFIIENCGSMFTK